MRRLALALAAIVGLAGPATAADLGLTTMGVSFSPGSGYVGPGDIVAGAVAVYSVRCYTGSQASLANVVNLRRQSDSATANIGFTGACALNTAAAASFAGTDATFTATSSGTSLVITTCASGTPTANDPIAGTGITAGTILVSLASGTACLGTWTTNLSNTVAVGETMTAQVALFVATWYDLSGNGLDMTQATAANQPQLLLSGGIGGKPSLAPAGSQFLSVPENSLLDLTGDQSIFAVAQTADTTNGQGILNHFDNGGSFNGWGIEYNKATAGAFAYWSSGKFAWQGPTSTIVANSPNLIGITRASGTVTFYQDGSASGTTTGSNAAPASSAFLMSNQAGGGEFLNGLLSEVYAYASAWSSGQVTAEHANTSAYFGTP